MNTQKLLPGMGCDGIEFFVLGNEVKALQNGRLIQFTELSFPVIQILREKIKADKQAHLALHDMQPDSEMKRVEQFAKCRFGGLDFQADIKNGTLQDGEYWPCPLRGHCPHEGVLCKMPKINQVRLTESDVQLVQLLSGNKTNDVIALELDIPLGTFHLQKKKLYEKFGVQTKQELVPIGIRHNII